MNHYPMKCEKCGKDFQVTESIFNQIEAGSRPRYCRVCYNNYRSDNTFVECKCSKCGRSFQISKRNFYQRTYRHRDNLCESCMDIESRQKMSDKSKAAYANMPSDKLLSMKKKQSESAKRRIRNMSPEEINRMHDRLREMRDSYHEYLSSLSEDDRKKLCANWGYNALTPEQKKSRNKKVSVAAKTRFNNMSKDEVDLIVRNLREAMYAYMESETADQRKERLEKLSNSLKEHYKNAPEEELAKRRDFLKKVAKEYIQSETNEQKAARFNKMRRTRREKYLNESPEERQARSDRSKKQWENISDEEKKILLQPMFEGCDRWKASLSDDELAELYRKWANSLHEYLMNESEDRKSERIERISNSHMNFWLQFSPDEKELRMRDMRTGWHKWLENLSDEEKERRSHNRSIHERDRWASLSDERKSEIIKARLLASPSKCDNNLNRKFIDAFNHSVLSDDYTIIPEHPSSGITTHVWDYAIYKGNALVAVVDLDGAYYHADNCDYDGIHSKEEYDEMRSLSVPDGVKICIINELLFQKTFQEMVKDIIMDYDDYIVYVLEKCRHMPFPSPYYSTLELLKSYEKLRLMNCDDKYHTNISLNTRLGDRLIQHFHHSIWHAHVKGKPSPYDAWKDDTLLRKVIKNRTIYQNHLNPNKILQGFNVSKVAPKVSVFSAGRAKMIISRYLSGYDTIFDPFSGFSGRMLGCVSLGKKYIGQDINLSHVNESNQIIDFLKKYEVRIDAEITMKDILQSSGEYPCLFTCPPYGDKEIWKDTPESNRSCDEWIDICLERFRCQRYVFVVDSTEKYKDHIVDMIINKSHYNKNHEYIISID